MARKKRKYTRRKTIRQEAIPASSLLLGLLPMILMAAGAGIYLLYSYQFSYTLPELSAPNITINYEFPEITFSFSEVGETILIWIGNFAITLRDFSAATFSEGIQASAAYLQAVQWAVVDFFQYIDIAGKTHALLSAVLWPLRFLNPMPLFTAIGEKSQEGSETVKTMLAPAGPLISFIWENFLTTFKELWENVVDLFIMIHNLLNS